MRGKADASQNADAAADTDNLPSKTIIFYGTMSLKMTDEMFCEGDNYDGKSQLTLYHFEINCIPVSRTHSRRYFVPRIFAFYFPNRKSFDPVTIRIKSLQRKSSFRD